jgi:hypothetical protein
MFGREMKIKNARSSIGAGQILFTNKRKYGTKFKIYKFLATPALLNE